MGDAWMQKSLPVYNWNYCIMNVVFILWLHVRTTKPILKQFSFYCWCCWIAIIIFIVIARFFFSFLLRCFSLIRIYMFVCCWIFVCCKERETVEFVKIDIHRRYAYFHWTTDRLWYTMFNYSIISFYYFSFRPVSIQFHHFIIHNRNRKRILLCALWKVYH